MLGGKRGIFLGFNSVHSQTRVFVGRELISCRVISGIPFRASVAPCVGSKRRMRLTMHVASTNNGRS